MIGQKHAVGVVVKGEDKPKPSRAEPEELYLLPESEGRNNRERSSSWLLASVARRRSERESGGGRRRRRVRFERKGTRQQRLKRCRSRWATSTAPAPTGSRGIWHRGKPRTPTSSQSSTLDPSPSSRELARRRLRRSCSLRQLRRQGGWRRSGRHRLCRALTPQGLNFPTRPIWLQEEETPSPPSKTRSPWLGGTPCSVSWRSAERGWQTWLLTLLL